MKRTEIKQNINNIIYVEPNYIFSTEEYDVNGLNTYEFAPPLEDYSIFVNLEVEIRGRNIQSSKTANGKKLVLSYITRTDGSSEVNFLQGSKIPIGESGATMNSLTTNYTDLFLGDLKKNGPSTEMFGIKSIDIAYNNYMVPEVTIEFIDVRGVALFAQREYYETNKNIDKALNSNNQEDIANTFFQCFFTFPYPKFTLLVKGFYGQPVSYELTCADFRARFDSNTGNFSCTAKFVGYYFSFLNDVMVNGLFAAPYSDYIGADYWASKEFKLEGVSGEQVNMPKFGALLRNMKDIQEMAIREAQSSPAAQEVISYEDQTGKFEKIKSLYAQFAEAIEKHVSVHKYQGVNAYYTSRNKQGSIKAALILVPRVNKTFEEYSEDDNGSIKGVHDSLVLEINEYNTAYPDKQLPIPLTFYDDRPTQVLTVSTNDETKAYVMENALTDMREKNDEHYGMFNRLLLGVREGNKKERNPLLDRKFAFYYNDNRFSLTLEEIEEELNKNIAEANDKLEKIKDETIANALGFPPTVENITKIAMAHFETFAWMIFSTAKTICNENPARTIESLQVGDIRNVADVSNKSTDTIVPPFPRVVQEVKRGDLKNMEESWVGDYAGDFREKDLVHGLINGVNQIAEEIIQYEKSSGSSENVEPGYGGGSNTPTMTTMKYPLSPLDLIADKNIYDANGYDVNDPSSLLGLVGLRAIQIMGINNFNNYYQSWDGKSKALGEAEAKNFLQDHKLSKEMLTKLSLCADNVNDVMQMMYGNESSTIKKPGDGSQPWPWRLDPNGKGIISERGDFDICRVKDNSFAVPFQQLSWSKIKNEIINSPNGAKAIWSNDYVNTYPFSNSVNDNIFTFDTNINRFSRVIENQLKDIDIPYYKDELLKQSKYNSEEYDKLIHGYGENIIAYVIDNAVTIIPSDESCMLPASKSFFADKSFGGGYNMDYFSNYNPGEGGENWKDKDGNEVKRRGDDGYDYYLKDFNSRDFTFTEFPGVNLDLSIHRQYYDSFGGDVATSVFAQGIYYRQEDARVRGLMFLASLGNVFKYEDIIENYICKKSVTLCVIPLPTVMFIGGLLWANTTDGKTKLQSGLNTDYYKDSLEKLWTLRQDVQKRFIKIFEKWVNEGVEGNSLLRSFNYIRSGMELFQNSKQAGDFFKAIGEVEDKNWIGGSRTWFKSFNGKSYDSISKFLAGELPDSFFNNYITIDEDIYGDAEEGTRGMRLGNRDGGPHSIHACNFALAGCAFSKNSKYFMLDSGNNVRVSTSDVRAFFEGFLSVVKEEKYDDAVDNTSVSQAEDPKDSNKDIKIGIYRYCKMIYDKWIAGLSDDEFEKKWTMKKFFEGDDKYFYFIDVFYNERIDIKINIGDFCDQIVSCYRNDQYSLLSLLSSVYSKNKLQFLCVQNFLDLGKKENIEKMFDPVPYTEHWDIKRHPNFIVLYPYETSSHLDIENSEYENDGFMINMPPSTTNRWPEPLTSRNATSNFNFYIPAFGVSYGKLYQSYFQDIDISMDNPTVTEQSIKAQFAIACQANEGEQTGDRSKAYEYGQDLYSIYSNNSYTCNITMMGCAWVQPLMYFVLNNIPMFRGTYLIEKVNHHIEPGNMTTKFMGVRMANVSARRVDGDIIRAKNDQDGSGQYNDDMVSLEEKLAGIDNDCPYKAFPLEETVTMSNLESLPLRSSEMENAKLTVAAFVSMGYSDVAGAAVAGNIMQETHYVPKYVNTMLKANHNEGVKGGLCQWQLERLTHLVKWDMNATEIITEAQPMPPFGKQLMFIDKECKEVSSYKKTLNALNGATTDDKLESATEAFRSNYEGGSEKEKRIKFAKDILKEYRNNPPVLAKNSNIAKNEDEHISKIAKGFVNALNKTASSSSQDVSIGCDPDKSNGDTVVLTNGHKSNRFSTVLDMILSAYFDKVESVTWVVPGDGNNINAVPVYYVVKVKEGCPTTKIYISSENNMNSNFEKNSVRVSTGNDVGIHGDFCKALYNKYKTDVETMKSDTNEVLINYDDLIKNYETEKCDDVLKEAGVTTNNTTTGTENESGYIGDWNLGLFVQKLHYWQSKICDAVEGKKSKARSKSGSCGRCTAAVNRALRDSGFKQKYWGEFPWELYDSLKKGTDFVEIKSAPSVPNDKEFDLGKIEKGDICLMWTNVNRSTHYHSCAFDGGRWYSDFIQNSCNVYRGAKPCRLEWHLFRHK